MVNKNTISTVPEIVDCACLIHDIKYDWKYVDRLYNSLCRNLTPQVRMHVYSEKHRIIPSPMIHHELTEWPGIRGPKRSWWYKIQLFNPAYHQGPMMYFDLDTVIVGNIDWIWRLPTDRFWAVKDFKYLFRPNKQVINSSIMWFDPVQWSSVYQGFDPEEVTQRRGSWHGDQDFIQEKISKSKIGYFDVNRVKSWRWELQEGGYDFKTRKHKKPGTSASIVDPTSILVFHGDPKPHQVTDPAIVQHWA